MNDVKRLRGMFELWMALKTPDARVAFIKAMAENEPQQQELEEAIKLFGNEGHIDAAITAFREAGHLIIAEADARLRRYHERKRP
jgi:hypothetical protein